MKNFFNQIASVIIIFFCVHHFWRARPGAASVKRWEIGRRPGTDWSWKTKSWDIWLTCISLSQSHTVTKLSYHSSVIQQPAQDWSGTNTLQSSLLSLVMKMAVSHYGVKIGIPSKSLPPAEFPKKVSSSMPLSVKCSPELDFSFFWGCTASKEAKNVTF